MAALVPKSRVVIDCYRDCWVGFTFSSPIRFETRCSLASSSRIAAGPAELDSVRSVKELVGPFC